MLLINREVGEGFEGFFQGSEVNFLCKNLALHAVGIAERNAVQICEKIEVRRGITAQHGAAQGASCGGF